VRRPGIEPGPSAWKADILTTRPTTLCKIGSAINQAEHSHAFLFFQQRTANLVEQLSIGRVAQWIRRRSSEPKIVGSSPTVVSIFLHESFKEKWLCR
jgi:hypothetical protein